MATKKSQSRTDEIGTVTFGSDPVVMLILWAPDDWTATVDDRDDEALARNIRARYLGQFQGPQYGYYGQLLLKQVAKDLGGTFAFLQELPGPDPMAVP